MMQPNDPSPSYAKDANWNQLASLPFQSWKDVNELIRQRIVKEVPEVVNKFTTWFSTMPVVAVYQLDDQICIQYKCSNLHRKQEVEKIRTLLEGYLSKEAFKGKQVTIELICDFPLPAPQNGIKPAADSSHDSAQPMTISITGLAVPTLSLSEGSPVNPTQADSVVLGYDGSAHKHLEPTIIGPDMMIDSDLLEYYRRLINQEVSDADLRAVLSAIESTQPGLMLALENQRSGKTTPTRKPHHLSPASGEKRDSSFTNLEEILVDPTYATAYDEIIHSHSAVYLPFYFYRHLRHMEPSDGLRYLALRQIGYTHGLKGKQGTQYVPATQKELVRWSTLTARSFPGNLDVNTSYLHLLAGKAPFIDYYQIRPTWSRWEDDAGYHWKVKDREYCVWKKDGVATDDCSQLIVDYRMGKPQWRKAPTIFRVQMSMPLAPEDADTLREVLTGFGVQTDPLGAIRQCLALSRDEIIPDRPRRLPIRPKKLYTVQELVLEVWGGVNDRALAAQVAVQSSILETHLIQPDNHLLKIPFYLLEKWGKRLSPAQLWTVIILMDRVYANSKDGEYRDTTTIKFGMKEMALWTNDEYTKGIARKISKWLFPFSPLSRDGDDDSAGMHFNPWFSLFASEILPENGTRVRNKDNSVQLNLRVLPLVPLAPEDTLLFASKMGFDRLIVRDAANNILGIEITSEEFVVYVPDGRTLRYSHSGELRFGEKAPVDLMASDKDLGGIEIGSNKLFYKQDNWSSALFCVLETRASALSCVLEPDPGAISCVLEPDPSAFFCVLGLDPGALFCVLLKLLILKLYGIKNNSYQDKTPSVQKLSDNIDSLEQFGSRQGQSIQWTEELSDLDWDFIRVAKSFGITDIKGLQEASVPAITLVSCALELYATPSERFTTGRVAVLVAKLRKNPELSSGIYYRLAELGPEQLQHYLRRAIVSWSPAVGDPDWDSTMGKAKRDDLIELAEKLALARILRATDQDP